MSTGQPLSIAVVSDIHYACDAEAARRGHELRVIPHPWLRTLTRAYRHFIWLRDPFAHNGLLDDFIARAAAADLVVANGDYSCDTAFVGVSDDAACESARRCLDRLRQAFPGRLWLTYGDHELGKMSLFGGQGGPRLASWRRALRELELEPFWRVDLGHTVLVGVVSSLVALPVFEPEALPEERPGWRALREEHLAQIREAFRTIAPNQRIVLFCHDPTALPFLYREGVVRQRLPQVAATIIGHLHTRLILWQSHLLAGMPRITFLGNSVRRMTDALQQARCWRPFRVRLCPSPAGCELLKDGGYLTVQLDPNLDPARPARVRFHRIRRPVLKDLSGW